MCGQYIPTSKCLRISFSIDLKYVPKDMWKNLGIPTSLTNMIRNDAKKSMSWLCCLLWNIHENFMENRSHGKFVSLTPYKVSPSRINGLCRWFETPQKIHSWKPETSKNDGWFQNSGWCSTPTVLLICSSFSRENGHPLLICSSLSTAQKAFFSGG